MSDNIYVKGSIFDIREEVENFNFLFLNSVLEIVNYLSHMFIICYIL